MKHNLPSEMIFITVEQLSAATEMHNYSMLYILTVTDEDAFKSLEICLTRFKLKELELTYLFVKPLKTLFWFSIERK